jgi:CBS-domain-containing membrane protein
MGPKVSDVMTSEVVCARLSTPYQELVRLLAEQHISAAPVVDDVGHVLGVVSETDRCTDTSTFGGRRGAAGP